jgi:CheY-like chemotaxis protein
MMDTATDSIEKVLIIDDNEIDTLIGAKVFEKNALANHVVTMNDASEALAYLENILQKNPQSFPDLILLDLNMPIMDGWTFLEKYKQMKGADGKKVVLLITSCTTDYKDFEQIKIHPMVSGFMDKPVSFEKVKQIQESYFQN